MDKTLRKFCAQISEELGIPEEKVIFVVRFQFDWLRGELINMTHASFLLNKLGVFSVNKKRADAYSDVLEEFKRGFKKPIDGELRSKQRGSESTGETGEGGV